MEHRLIAAGPALALLFIGFGSAPAFAYNANQFKDACAIVAGCTSGKTVNGYTYGDSNGTHYDCPPVGHKPNDNCIIVRTAPTASPVVLGLSTSSTGGHAGDGGADGGSGGDTGFGSTGGGGPHFGASDTVSGLKLTTGPRNTGAIQPLH